jgi:hypothetical protein
VDIHIPIGVGDVAAAALRLGFQVSNASFGGRKTNLLGVCKGGLWTGKKEEKRSQDQKSARRGESPRTRMKIQEQHAVNENSWIA